MTIFSKNWGGMAPLTLRGYAYAWGPRAPIDDPWFSAWMNLHIWS